MNNDCPECGCNYVHSLRSEVREGQIFRNGTPSRIRSVKSRYQCDACGHVFTVQRYDEPTNGAMSSDDSDRNTDGNVSTDNSEGQRGDRRKRKR